MCVPTSSKPASDPALPEPLHEVGHEDLARRGHRLEPRAFDHRDTVDVVVLVGHLARADADADRERRDRVRAIAVFRHGALHGDRGRHRRRRGGERGLRGRRRSIATRAAVRRDRGREDRVVVAAEVVGAVFAEPAPQRTRTDDVGEQDAAHARRS